MMHFFLQTFNLLDNNRQKLFLISFCFFFSIIFLNVFVPFNMNHWENDAGIQQFFRLSMLATVGTLVLVFTQFFLRKAFKIKTFNRISFMCWAFMEVILIALVLTILYRTNFQTIWIQIVENIQYSLLIILLPYFIALLLIYVYQLQSKNKMTLKMDGLISIPDEKGITKISIQLDSLLYFESADNYAIIHYLDDGKAKRKLIRNTLKKLEGVFDDALIKRCHRSYIINSNNIKLIEKASGKLFIHLKNCEKVIPVSRNYYPQFMEKAS